MGIVPDHLGFSDFVAGSFDFAADSVSVGNQTSFGEGQPAAVPSIGVEFSHETPRDNMLFFMAMRKFLDEFDGVTIDT